MKNISKILIRGHHRYVTPAVGFWYRNWGERSFAIGGGIFIGAITAVAAALLHALVLKLNNVGDDLRNAGEQLHEYGWIPVWFLLPLVGITLSCLVQRKLGGPRYAKSLSPLILSIFRKRIDIKFSECFTHIISSALAVGFGGAAGLEAPSVLTGAAIGANTGKFSQSSRNLRMLMVGCGAAAAIAAIFDSPIAGVLFAAEVLLPEFSVSMLVPVLLSSAVSSVISHLLIGDSQFIIALHAPWRTDAIPCYFLCGIFCALVGVYVIRAAYFTGNWIKGRLHNTYQRLFIGGGLLCILLFCFPVLRGQGYGFIEMLFNGNGEQLVKESLIFGGLPYNTVTLLFVVAAAILLKVVAASLTVDSGGDGGIFAPTMFVGGFTGFIFAKVVNLTGLIQLQEFNFVAVGMCGVFTAVLRAPLSGIFLIAEVTRSYTLFVPLMIVSAVSFCVSRIFEPESIYRKALAEAKLLSGDRDSNLLRRLPVRTNFSRQYQVLHQESTVADVVAAVENRPDEVFPVLDADGKLLGLVRLAKVMRAMLHPEVYEYLLVFDLMEPAPAVLSLDDNLALAMEYFDRYKRKYLPVCDKQGHFRGFVVRAEIFARYRDLVKEADDL